jgi:formylglycine-generating enzyme required for sulfatase activity
MSQFNKKLDQAKQKQKRIYLYAGITLLTTLLLIIAVFVASRGTRVEIIPLDAKEHAVYQVSKGLGFSLGNMVYSFVGGLDIEVFSPGFKVAKGSIDPVHLGKIFHLELLELPGHLVVDISGDDGTLSQTAWQINGRDVDHSDKLDIELEAGWYTLNIDNPYFQPKKMDIEIRPGEQTRLKENLQSVKGRMDISSTPSAAMVFLNEKNVGSTPLQLEKNGGEYSLKLVLKNHIENIETLSITQANPEVRRHYKLKLQKGSVRLNLVPKGGTLLVNGVKRTEPLLLDATVKHRLIYMKPGFYSNTRTVLLTAGEEKQVSIQLKPEMGKLEIFSSPPATVWIDGKDSGQSPFSISLSAVSHEIRFEKSGYRSVVKQVRPKGGKIKSLSVSLITEYQARLKEAPKEFSNKMGIKLKLFLAQDSLVMGAPRSDKGQRANEFQRKIRMTKPFYASLFEITNGQYIKFDSKRAMGPGNTPVTSVSWQEAAAFCNWLSATENIDPFYKTAKGQVTGFYPNTDGYRLLSEAEWEWLARKAGKTKQTRFAWGNDNVIPPETANVADESAKGQVRFFVPNYTDGYAHAAPVGSFNREPSSLYDMAGNVSEWVHDVYSIVPPLRDTISHNPLGEPRGYAHVVKGANWRSGTITTLRPAFREGLTAGRDDLGFRIGRYLYGGKNE